ncbi:MAG: hypothetical protein QW480_02470 [Candidatus Aenigmatarchaeota archaeon]
MAKKDKDLKKTKDVLEEEKDQSLDLLEESGEKDESLEDLDIKEMEDLEDMDDVEEIEDVNPEEDSVVPLESDEEEIKEDDLDKKDEDKEEEKELEEDKKEDMKDEDGEDSEDVEEIDENVDSEEIKKVKEAFMSMMNSLTKKVSKTQKTEKVDAKVDGKTSTKGAEQPKADDGIEGEKEVKTHVKSSQKNKLEKKAMDGDSWAINPKEIEKPEKAPKAKRAVPSNFSASDKEINSEEVDIEGSNAAAAKAIKDVYNKMGPVGDEVPMSFDKKSYLNKDIQMLKEALRQSEAEKAQILRKQAELEERLRIKEVSDKIFEVVSYLKNRNLITPGYEEDVVDVLSNKFASVEMLESLKKMASFLNAGAMNKIASEIESESGVVPQVELETPKMPVSEDIAAKLAKIWKNKTQNG